MSDTSAGSDSGFHHRPVLVDRIVALFAPVPPGVIVDATVGGGGHAAAILEAHPHLWVLGLDQDADALAAAGERLAPFGDRAVLRHRRFDRLEETVDEVTQEDEARVSGVLFDLGVSSPQLDRASRGFSYRHAGPLDMRMDQAQARTAADIVNTADARELAELLRRFGDERYAARIARAIVAARPLHSTVELAEVVRDAIPAPARRQGGHPAKRTFQALRIVVNEELDVLPGALDAAIGRLRASGRCAVLAYHSGEDRIVKRCFRSHARGGWTGPAHLPTPAEVTPTVRLLKAGAWKAPAGEIESNPRAASARLRAVERLAIGP